MMTSPELLLHKHEIEQVLFRYARGVDRRDWDLVRSAYHPDAIDLHGIYDGDIEGFLRNLKERHENIEQSTHLISNIVIQMYGPVTALAESYYICYQRLKSARLGEAEKPDIPDLKPGETLQFAMVGRYIDRFERRDGAWRIARRTVVYDVLERYATPVGGGLDRRLALSRRDRDDVLYLERRRMQTMRSET